MAFLDFFEAIAEELRGSAGTPRAEVCDRRGGIAVFFSLSILPPVADPNVPPDSDDDATNVPVPGGLSLGLS